jgi:tetratricopeptide (TPR) repeat protein
LPSAFGAVSSEFCARDGGPEGPARRDSPAALFMANNGKIREQARVQEARENWRQAVDLYRQVVESPEGEEVDIGLWNRIGDLHLKLNETERAVDAYEQAVNGYADVGLHNNAIALCRKILRLVPGRASIYLRLGQISAAKGFLADARQNFLEYAERMQRGGKLDASFEALKEFADLSPTDTDVRRLLADQLASHGRTVEAVEQYRILIAQAEDKGAAAVAEELRGAIRAIDPTAETSGLHRDAVGRGDDDFRAAFDMGALAAAPRAPATEPATSAPHAGGGIEIDLGEITPLAGLEPTNLDAPPPAAPAGDAGLSLGDFRIEPLDATPPPTAEEQGDELPLMDFSIGESGPPPAQVQPLDGLETRFDSLEDAEEEGEPLPLMDFSAEPEPLSPAFDAAPARASVPDRVDELRARFARAPEDASARGELVAQLDSRGLGYEADGLLEEGHRALAAQARYAEALDVVADLAARRRSDGGVLQKQVEYAFRCGNRERLITAYLALGEHLVAQGEQVKGVAVYQRVLELDPENDEARRVAGPPAGGGRAKAAAASPAPAAPAPAPAAPAGPPAEYIDLGALIMEDEPQQGSTRFVVEEKEPTGDEDRDFADMLAHFRQKVSENIEVEDSSSHYDLGLAFKEMGLIDEAIAEFQVALRGGANPLATLELLGQCFVEKGQYPVAARVLDRALRITGATEPELIGVLYQLGRAQESLGDPNAARDLYERVLAIDIRFRDTARRLEALRRKAGGAQV